MAINKEQRREWFDGDFVQQHARAAIAFGRDEWEQSVANMLTSNLIYASGLESPLEMAFFAWWSILNSLRHMDVTMVLQEPVTIDGRTYRLDMSLYDTDKVFADQVSVSGLRMPRVAVELDGHEWHERTKEQVILRDERDRALQAAGWCVFHVSGSAFHRDPEACVWGIYANASKVFWDFKHQVWSSEKSPC